MIRLLLIALLFLSLMALPFVVAMVTNKRIHDVSLMVRYDNVRDPRYFAKSFGAMMEHGLQSYTGGGTIRLSREEKLSVPPLRADVCETLLYAAENFAPETAITFTKELYGRGAIVLPPGTHVRAAQSRTRLTLGEGCEVVRWVDGEICLRAEKNCDLGISASSARELYVEVGCNFRRLYAPEIFIGGASVPESPVSERIEKEIERDIRRVKQGEIIEKTLVRKADLIIEENAVIYGSVKSTGTLHVRAGTVITGNAVADGEVVLERGVRVGGIVFSQENALLGPGVQVGARGKIKSVIAKNRVVLSEGAHIYGYVNCEHTGVSVSAEEFARILGK